METLNSMLYLLSYNSEVTTHALGVLSSYGIFLYVRMAIQVNKSSRQLCSWQNTKIGAISLDTTPMGIN